MSQTQDNPKRPISVNLDERTRDKLDAIAHDTQRSRSQVVRQAVAAYTPKEKS